MRLIVTASVIVAGFGFGAWGISLLLSGAPAWVNVALCIVWLFVLVVAALLFGNKGMDSTQDARVVQQRFRDNLLYIGIASVLVALLASGSIRDLDKGVHRHINASWVVCSVVAACVLAFSIKEFWWVRRCWQLWAVLAVYVTLHFSIAVPALSRLDRVVAGYIYLIGLPELMLVSFIIPIATRKRTHNLR